MIEVLIKEFSPKVQLLIDISGIKKGKPISAEVQLTMDKQEELISALGDGDVESLGINILDCDPKKHLSKDSRFHCPILMECPLAKLEVVKIFIKRKLEDLGIVKIEEIKIGG